VTETAQEKGIPIFPEKPPSGEEGFLDREFRYAKHWLASMGIYEYEEPHDPWWGEMHNFMVSIRDDKPAVVPLRLGMADAKGVIYGNRAIETGQKVYWPGQSA
jgi:hypothetical protein